MNKISYNILSVDHLGPYKITTTGNPSSNFTIKYSETNSTIMSCNEKFSYEQVEGDSKKENK